jgi:hypothetical protein
MQPLSFIKADMYFSSKDKNFFFDRPQILNHLDTAKAKLLGKAGANCRKKIQQGLIRAKSGTPSKPGTPPRQRLPGDDGLRKITYNFLPAESTVVLKVIRWNERKGSPYNQPALHEFGGTVSRIVNRLSPKGETKWMFEPENAAKYIGLQKAIRKYERYQSQRALKVGKKPGKIKTLDDFGLEVQARPAAYPRRSFMATGLKKYRQSKHFQKIMQDLLKG